MNDTTVELTCVECGIGFETEPGTETYEENCCEPCLEEEF